MIIMILYWLLVLFFLALSVWTFFTEKNALLQLNSLMVTIVLLLRLLLIK